LKIAIRAGWSIGTHYFWDERKEKMIFLLLDEKCTTHPEMVTLVLY
jgi:hypothetical protein